MQRKQSSGPLATKTGMHVGSEEVDAKLIVWEKYYYEVRI
jgi:hypothetical protein